MQNFRNYYEILGVARESTGEDIKRAFRKLARQFHPDLNPGDKTAEEKFKDINEAYEFLSDPDKRSQYDQFGKFWQQRGFGTGGRDSARGWNWPGRGTAPDDVDFSQFRNFNDFVDQVLNEREPVRRAASRDRRPDVRSANGRAADSRSDSRTEGRADGRTDSRAADSRIPVREPVNPRSGADSRDNFRPGTTKTTRTVSRPTPRDAEASLSIPLEKAYTGGRERIRLQDGRSLEVNMPGGMVSGQRIRLKEQGEAGGDLFLIIDVAPHPFFQIQGADVVCKLPVTVCEAVLGSQVEVPTLDGLVKMSIPPGVKSGQRLRLANKGYPTVEDERGDQIVEIQIVLPKEISDEERELYEQLRCIETFAPRANLPV
jgi:curved DNA-binding protein